MDTYPFYVVLEAILVGCGCVFLYIGLQWIKPLFVSLFVLGILKHGIGYGIGIESLYCRYGQACLSRSLDGPIQRKEAHSHHIVVETLLEGLAFVLGGFLLSGPWLRLGMFQRVFLLGFFLHLLAEASGLHTKFCTNNCVFKTV